MNGTNVRFATSMDERAPAGTTGAEAAASGRDALAAVDREIPDRSVLRAGTPVLDPNAHLATLEGEELNLTPTEFRLLHNPMERQSRTQSRRQLLAHSFSCGKLTARAGDAVTGM